MPRRHRPGLRPILRDLLAGVCVGAIGSLLVWQFYPGFWKEPLVSPRQSEADLRALRHAQPEPSARTVGADAVLAGAPPSPCEMEPIVPPGSGADGSAVAEVPFPGTPIARAKVLLGAAQAAAAHGRPRDAEVALLAACRESEKASRKPSVPLARVLQRMGESYATAAARDAAADVHEQLLERARQLLTLSADAYASALGPLSSRPRQARERVASLAAADGAPHPAAAQGTVQVVAAPAVAELPAPRAAAGQGTHAALRQDAHAPGLGAEPQRVAAHPPAADSPELQQLASDLARLRQQAGAVSRDPQGFARRMAAAQAQRDQCADAECLRRWYASRKRELLAEF